ncbi:MAG: hypothetical protein HYU66_03690 [Armatimonadetes bacterium]|nr:hypothetical protein [Armatimonadota bacterium]
MLWFPRYNAAFMLRAVAAARTSAEPVVAALHRFRREHRRSAGELSELGLPGLGSSPWPAPSDRPSYRYGATVEVWVYDLVEPDGPFNPVTTDLGLYRRRWSLLLVGSAVHGAEVAAAQKV